MVGAIVVGSMDGSNSEGSAGEEGIEVDSVGSTRGWGTLGLAAAKGLWMALNLPLACCQVSMNRQA